MKTNDAQRDRMRQGVAAYIRQAVATGQTELPPDYMLAVAEELEQPQRSPGKPPLSASEKTVRVHVPMPQSMRDWCSRQKGGAAAYIRLLIAEDIVNESKAAREQIAETLQAEFSGGCNETLSPEE